MSDEKQRLINRNIKADCGKIFYYEQKPDLESIKKEVSEWYLMLKLDDGRTMYIDEEARSKKLPFNKNASELVKMPISGNVILANKETN